MNSLPPTYRLLLTLLVYFLVKAVVSLTALSGFALVLVDAEFESGGSFSILHSADGNYSAERMVSSRLFDAGKRDQVRIYLHNDVCRHIRIDPGDTAGHIRIYQIKLASYYGESLSLGPREMLEFFQPANQISTFRVEGDHLLIRSDGNDPYFISTRPLKIENLFLEHIFPLLITLLFWLFLASFKPAAYGPIYDLQHKSPSSGIQISSLDGVRGIAALMVLAEHTGLLDGIGAIGVWLFFCLSGFLLATPFARKPAVAYSPAFMQEFFLRRIKRIIPMYYTFLAITMMFQVRNPELFRHLLFLQGDGHLWTIPQEMFFYLLLPFAMLLCCAPVPRRKLFSICVLALLLYCANTYLTKETISLYGYGTRHRVMVGIFLSGVLFAFIRERLMDTFVPDKNVLQTAGSFVGILILVGLVAGCTETVKELTRIDIELHFGIVGFLAAFFVLAVTLSERSLLARIVGFLPFRAIGIVGYSFYLLHPKMMGFSREISEYYFSFQLNGAPLFLVAGILTYLLSTLTYAYIERPFIVRNRRE